MQPTHAEVARTLAAGHLPANAHISCHPGPFPVRHVTDPQGRLLLLSPRDGALATALRPTEGSTDTALVLEIADVPPTPGAPSLGRVWVAGWSALLTGDDARAATLEYADTDAATDLLDVGDTQVLHRMHVAEIRHEHRGVLVDIDPDEYAGAGPDPLAPIEFDLLADLADHVEEIGVWIRSRLGPAAGPGDQPEIVRLDRYGFLVRIGDRLARLAFPRPVHDRYDLAHLLHPILCHRCGQMSPSR